MLEDIGHLGWVGVNECRSVGVEVGRIIAWKVVVLAGSLRGVLKGVCGWQLGSELARKLRLLKRLRLRKNEMLWLTWWWLLLRSGHK